MSDERSITFILRVGRALHRYGAPTHRLEDALTELSRSLGLDGEFFVTPTAIFASFGASEHPESRLIRARPSDVDLGRLSELDAIIIEVIGGSLSLEDANARIDAALSAPPRYQAWLSVLCFGLASAGAARFFGGGWPEMATASGIGLLAGLLSVTADRVDTVGRIFSPLTAILASFVAIGVASQASLSVYTATLGGLIVLVPGLTLTIAITELATGHLVSGTARLTGAVAVFVMIAFGVALGTRAGEAVFGAAVPPPLATPAAWTQWVSLATAPLAFTVLFRAQPAHVGWIALSSVVAFGGARLGATLMGPELGVFLGAVLVGAVSNAIARVTNRPASVPLVPGLMLLVPGSLGFRSLSSLLERDVVSGMEMAFTMTLVAVALVTGLLVGNVLVSPRRAL